MAEVLQQLIYGLSQGSTYALIALGITLVYRGMDIINFSQGEIFMVGAFIGYVFHVDLGLPIWLAMILAFFTAMLFGSLLEIVFLRYIEKSNQLTIFMMTVALYILLRNSVQLIFGSSAYKFPSFIEAQVSLGGVVIGAQHLIIIATTIIIMFFLYILFTKTQLGLSVRAVAQDKTTARMMGINVSWINNFTIALTSGLGAIAGIVYAPIAVVVFDMGNLIMLKGFTAALLGGLGLLSGAILGGFVLGVIEQFGTLKVSAYKDLISFSILLLIILVKPSGILGKKQIKKV